MKLLFFQISLVSAQLQYIYNALNEYINIYSWDGNVLPLTYPLPVFDNANFVYDLKNVNYSTLVIGANDFQSMMDRLNSRIQANININNATEISSILAHFQELVNDPTIPYAMFYSTVSFMYTLSQGYNLPMPVYDTTRTDDGLGYPPITFAANFTGLPLMKDNYPREMLQDGTFLNLISLNDSQIQQLSTNTSTSLTKRLVKREDDKVVIQATVESQTGVANARAALQAAGATDIQVIQSRQNEFTVIGTAPRTVAVTGLAAFFHETLTRTPYLTRLPRTRAGVAAGAAIFGASVVVTAAEHTGSYIKERLDEIQANCESSKKRAGECDLGNSPDLIVDSLATLENFGVTNLGQADIKVKTIKAMKKILQGNTKFTVADILTDSPTLAGAVLKVVANLQPRDVQAASDSIAEVAADPSNANLIDAIRIDAGAIGKIDVEIREKVFNSLPHYKVLSKILKAAQAKNVPVDFSKPIDSNTFDQVLSTLDPSNDADLATLSDILGGLPSESDTIGSATEDGGVIDKIEQKISTADPSGTNSRFNGIRKNIQNRRNRFNKNKNNRSRYGQDWLDGQDVEVPKKGMPPVRLAAEVIYITTLLHPRDWRLRGNRGIQKLEVVEFPRE
ncbi:hypothetical protein HDV01_003072 [Terramyces sp. JEL0728]|nr:hypothetical protein HDV01_003072 [Terramyces sp. JEL0728]